MKRALDLAVKTAVAATFVASVEFFRWQQRRKKCIAKSGDSAPARLRVRHGSDRALVIFNIEGRLDEFVARLLAFTVAQVPRSATMIVDLSAAGPIEGKALTVFARVFAGRQVRLRGLGSAHSGLLALPIGVAAPLQPHPSLRLAA